MELDAQTLKEGLKFICGTWQVDYVVNGFSNDLAKIPASEFVSQDGSTFAGITYTFLEDHTMIMRDTSSGKEEHGSWEQTDWFEYHYTAEAFLNLPDSIFLHNAETLNVQDEHLCFSIAFLGIGMKKIEEGIVTEEVFVDSVAEACGDDMAQIVGSYSVAKGMTILGGRLGMFTREAVLEDLQKRLDAGTVDSRDARQTRQIFETIVEFTEDHRVRSWMKLPDNLPEQEIRKALEAGQILDVKDGLFCYEETQWKAVDGKYYYDTHQTREVMGQKQSSWNELIPDADGLLPFADGMMLLERI